MAAAMQGNLDLIRAFVGAVTDVHMADRSGRNALDYAVIGAKPGSGRLAPAADA